MCIFRRWQLALNMKSVSIIGRGMAFGLVEEWLFCITRQLKKVEKPQNISKLSNGASRRIMMLDPTPEEHRVCWISKQSMGTLSCESDYAKSWELPSLPPSAVGLPALRELC